MHRFPVKWFGLAFAVAILGAALAWALWPVPVLEFRKGSDGPVLKKIAVSPGDMLTYRYIHSIQKTPVDEIMEITRDRLIVRETIYDMYGVGLPSDDLDGTYAVAPDGRFEITNMSRDIMQWPVRVATTNPQTIKVDGQDFTLQSLAPPMTLLVVDVASDPRISTLVALPWSL